MLEPKKPKHPKPHWVDVEFERLEREIDRILEELREGMLNPPTSP